MSLYRSLLLPLLFRMDAEGVHVAHPQSAVWVAGDAPVTAATSAGGTKAAKSAAKSQDDDSPAPGAEGA